MVDLRKKCSLFQEISQEDADKLLAEDEESYAYAELATGNMLSKFILKYFYH